MTVPRAATTERPRNFVDDWTAPGTARPPTTQANPLSEIRPGDRPLRPLPIGARFCEVQLEDVAGAPQVDWRWGGLDLSPDGREVAFAWDRPGRHEIFVAPIFGERIYQLTDGSERAVWPRWSPDGGWIAFLRDTGGSERFAIWVVTREGKRPRDLTRRPELAHREIEWSPDGSQIAFACNSSGQAFGIELLDVASGARRALTDGTYEDTSPHWSPDGSWLVFSSRRETTPTNSDLYLVSAGGGEPVRLETRGGLDGESLAARWSPDGRSLAFTTSIRGRYEIALAHLDGTRVRRVEILTNTIHDSTEPVWRPDGRGVLYLQAEQARESVRRVFVVSHADSPVSDMPGVHKSVRVGPQSEAFVAAFSSARRPCDVWVRLQRSVAPHPITSSLHARVDPETLVEPIHVDYPGADGVMIPALLYIPHAEALRGAGRPPAVLHIHGGPTGQHHRLWDPASQWFAHRGYVVLAPNIRGSTGYGREFQEANRGDWGGKDLGDVIGALDWLDREEIADTRRVAAYGGSYGGFMTMLALAKAPDRWAAGVSVVGVVSWKTLYETTRGDLREYLRRELGDPEQAESLYRDRSPLTHASKIRAPLLLLQGANDPRVPRSEAEQVVEALRKSGTTFEYHEYADEGHGFAKTANRIDALRRATDWLDRHLRVTG